MKKSIIFVSALLCAFSVIGCSKKKSENATEVRKYQQLMIDDRPATEEEEQAFLNLLMENLSEVESELENEKESTGLYKVLEEGTTDDAENLIKEPSENVKTLFKELNKMSDDNIKEFLTENYSQLKPLINEAESLDDVWQRVLGAEKIIKIFNSIPDTDALNEIINKKD